MPDILRPYPHERIKLPTYKEPVDMTLEEFVEEYKRVMQAVQMKEKNPMVPLTEEEHALHEQDWKAFSRARGYSEDDITEYEYWLTLSGQRDNLSGAVNDPWRRSRPNWAEMLWNKHQAHKNT